MEWKHMREQYFILENHVLDKLERALDSKENHSFKRHNETGMIYACKSLGL
jgi:hypothetical protein